MGSRQSGFLGSHRPSRHRGLAAVWFAIVGIALVAVFSLAMDYARIWHVQHQLQVAADSAALAIAQLPLSTPKQRKDARLAAVDFVKTNYAIEQTPLSLDPNKDNLAGGDIVLGSYDFNSRAFTITTDSPNAVQVNAHRDDKSPDGPIKLIFGTFWHTPASKVSGTAIAVVSPPGPAGIILLDPNKSPSLGMSGGDITVTNGIVQVDSSADRAVQLAPSASINASALDVVGSQSLILGNFAGKLAEGSPTIADPLLSVVAPSPASLSTGTQDAGSMDSGVYDNEVKIPGGQRIQMKRGVYIFKNGLTLDGGSSIDASAGALLYFQGGQLKLTSNSSINITALHDGTAAGDIAIYYDRSNTSNLSMSNSSSLTTDGSIYTPSTQINLTDNASITSTGNLIAASATLNGSPSITIDSKPAAPTNNSVTLVQ